MIDRTSEIRKSLYETIRLFRVIRSHKFVIVLFMTEDLRYIAST